MPGQFDDYTDFEAVIRVLTPDEGGRQSPAFNGIRWDFAYAEDEPADEIYMIWPEFLDEDGVSFSTDRPLPVDRSLQARMRIVVPEMRVFHRRRIRPGTRFFCHEGSRRVAEGVVTRLTGLRRIVVDPEKEQLE